MNRPKTLVEALRYAAGQDIELRFQDRPGRVTAYRYPEVLERARRVAGVASARVRAGDRVALILPTSIHFMMRSLVSCLPERFRQLCIHLFGSGCCPNGSSEQQRCCVVCPQN